MVLLTNDVFLSELARLFQRVKSKGSITITMKRYDGKDRPDPKPGSQKSKPRPEPSEYMCLVRAKIQHKKISTVIHGKDVNRFQVAYAAVLKSQMDGLKKLKKPKGRTKAKA